MHALRSTLTAVGFAACGAASAATPPVAPRVVSIAAGEQSSFAVTEDGRVLSWGLYAAWEAEGRPTAASLVPVAVPGIDDALTVDASLLTVCVTRRAHPITCWRSSETPRELPLPAAPDQLEVGGDAVCVRVGTAVQCVGNGSDPQPFASAKAVARLEVSMSELFAVTTDGRLWCTGAGTYDPCLRGRDDDGAPSVPLRLPARAVHVATSGVNHCVALEGGETRCWGRDVTEYSEAESWHQVPPRPYPALGDAAELVLLESVACARTAEGRVTCQPLQEGAAYVPVERGAVELAAGREHACARTDAGQVRCWGRGTDGQLGDGTGAAVPTPTRVPVDGVTRVSVTEDGVFATGQDGRVRSLAASAEPLPAGGDDEPEPFREARRTFPDAEQRYVLPEAVCALRAGTVRCDGVLGYRRDDTLHRVGPDEVLLRDVAQLEVARTGTACARDTRGVVRCFGGIESGGNVVSEVVEVAELRGASTIAVGLRAVCGVFANGQLRCAGLFGIDPGAAVPGAGDVVEVALGERHGCARARDGRVRCFGANHSGQLGVGDQRAHAGAVEVPGLDGVVAIACGSARSCAVSAGGDLRCWGDNWNGELGLPPPAVHSESVPVAF